MSLYINGKWSPGSDTSFNSVNPVTSETIWSGNQASTDDVNQAVNAAHQALSSWSQYSIEDRIAFLKQMEMQLIAHQDELTSLLCQEIGKVQWDAKTEVAGTIAKINISIQAYLERNNIDITGSATTRYKAHGVAAIFGPFNFPIHLTHGHIVPALLAGNTVVLKPSELTPKTLERYVELWEKAGLPPGVLNLVQGGSNTGKALTDNSLVRAIYFTGSYPVGRIIQEASLNHPKRIVALEMGGNNPLVVEHTEALEQASQVVIASAFLSAGQRCTCARKLILIESEQNQKLLEQIITTASELKVGLPQDDPQPFYASLISAQAAQAVLKAQEDLIRQGAKPLLKAKPHEAHPTLLFPSILDVTSLKNLPDEEVFGPMLQVKWVKTWEDAINEANHTEYGLSAGLISDSEKQFKTFYHAIQAGIINWNCPTVGASSEAPFGGIGKSGNFRPAGYFSADYCSYPTVSVENDQLNTFSANYPGL